MTTLVDQFGRPIDIAAIREPQTARVGHLAREFDEHPSRGLTPARLAAIMLDAERGDLVGQLDLADDMEERDGHLYAALGQRRGAITALRWNLQPPRDASESEKALTDQVRDWLDMVPAHATGMDGGMDLVLQQMTDAVLKGYAAQEMVWGYQADGAGHRVMVPRITAQPQRWFTVSGDRRRFLLRSQYSQTAVGDETPVMGEELIPVAWLMHVHPARNGYLARMALSRVLAWPFLFKNYSIRDLAEFLEIYGLPLRVGKYPTGASDDEKSALLRAVRMIGHNAAGIIPQGMALEFQAAAAGTEVPFAAMWDRMDDVQSKAILGQTLTLGEGRNGTQALGEVHDRVRGDILAADCRAIERSINAQLIHPLVVLNRPGVNPRRLPRLVIDDGQADDMAVYAQHLPALAKAGVRIPVRWVHERLRIPEAADDERVLVGPAELDAPDGPAKPGEPDDPEDQPPAPRRKRSAGAALRSQPAPQQPQRDAIDDLVDEQLLQWRPVLDPMVGQLVAELERAVAAGESAAAFAARLPQLAEQLDSSPLTERLARAALAARLAGEADLDLTGEDA